MAGGDENHVGFVRSFITDLEGGSLVVNQMLMWILNVFKNECDRYK